MPTIHIAEQVVKKEIKTFGMLSQVLDKEGYKKKPNCNAKALNAQLLTATKECEREHTARVAAVNSVIEQFFELSVAKAPVTPVEPSTADVKGEESVSTLPLPENPTIFDEVAHYVLTTAFDPFNVEMKLQDMGVEFRKGKGVNDIKMALDRALKRKCPDEFVRLGILSTAIEKVLKEMSGAKRKKQNVINP